VGVRWPASHLGRGLRERDVLSDAHGVAQVSGVQAGGRKLHLRAGSGDSEDANRDRRCRDVGEHILGDREAVRSGAFQANERGAVADRQDHRAETGPPIALTLDRVLKDLGHE